MPILWTPDTCPASPACVLEVVNGHKGLVRIVRLCAHHQRLRQSLASDDELFNAVLNKNREKNTAIRAELVKGRSLDTIIWRIDGTDKVIIE